MPAANGGGPPNGAANGVGTSAQQPSQNEVLANFFQGLLEKKAINSGTSSRSPQPPANGSTANLASGNPKLSNVPTNGITRQMVQEEVEKMKMFSSSATAGTVGK